ncbi:MAG: BCSC C-terminal domain-containing protein [Legionella longbeachae]|nr:BCSC C-terminal domain-containing protein [Legionella longbeachae]
MFKSRFCFLLLGLATTQAFAEENLSSQQMLFNQVIWGEAYYKDDLVKNSLYRLELIDPDNSQVIAAHIRLAIREKNLVLANKLLEKLRQKAPDSIEYKQAQMSLVLTQPDARQKLQQARVLSMSGHTILAKAQYDALFHGNFPTPELTAEYWMLVSQIPEQRENAFNHLQALYFYLQNHKIYPINNTQKTWLNGLQNIISRIWVSKGDIAFKANQLDLALKDYQQALLLNKENYYAIIGIGEIAFKHKDFVSAENAYKQAIIINPDLHEAFYDLFELYKSQSLSKALHYLDTLPDAHKIKFQDDKRGLESDIYQEQAEQFIKINQWAQAVDKYRQAQKIDPDNVWLIYHYAFALKHIGQIQKANQLFLQLAVKQKKNPNQAYAYALFLSDSDKIQQALARLHAIPQAQWNDGMRKLAQRLTTEMILLHAQKLRDNGNKQEAVAYLLQQAPTIRIKMTLADWAFNDREYAPALHYYQDVAKHEPLNADAYLGIIETLIAVEEKLLFRDAARVETVLRQFKSAKEDYKKAMVNSKITSSWPATNDTYTYLTRNHVEDDWLKRSIRSEAALLYQQQETRITLDQDYWRLPGTAGTSDYRAGDLIAQADWALYNGRAFLRADDVTLGAGTFSTNNGVYFSDFGTCNINGCRSGMVQQTKGVGWDGGWQSARWGMDIGQTPIGFPVSNWIGGINYSNEIKHIGWTVTASRRPMTNSLLSFSGTVDPNTGITWGGVVATGLTLSLSYDRGGSHGFWANVIGSTLTGKNVASNERILLLDGYYYKLINEDNRRLVIGLTNMVWHYNKNLFGYTLGLGGYYSPQMFLSLTMPVNYRKRTGNWSYELGGSITCSRATTQNNALYPLPQLVPNLNNTDNTVQTGGSSMGYGYSILALIERRLGSHFMVGGLMNLQQSTDYTPSNLALFLRYSFEGWQGDMDMPITPLIPYSSFR